MASPTALTLDFLRKAGWLPAVVERYLPHVQRKRDLWGIGDVLAVCPATQEVLLIQCTTGAHVPDRLRRIQARPELGRLLAAGVAVEVWGWQLVRGRWCVKRIALTPDMQVATVQGLPRPRRARRGERQKELFGPDEEAPRRYG